MRFGLALLLVFTTSSLVLAGNIAQQKVTFQIDAINEISINGGSNNLTISFEKNSQRSSGTARWAITTNENNKRVVGILDADLPAGVELYVELEAPKASLSNGSVSISTNPQDLVTGINRVAQDNLKIGYKLITETDTNEVELQRVLTIVLMDGF